MAGKKRIGAQRNTSDVGSKKNKMFKRMCPLRRKIWPITSNIERSHKKGSKKWDLET